MVCSSGRRYSLAPFPVEKIRKVAAIEEEGEIQDSSKDMTTPPRTDSATEVAEEDDDFDEEEFFNKEVEALFRRAVTGESVSDHVVLMLNSLKLAYDRSFSDCALAIFRAFINLASETPHLTSEELLRNSKEVVIQWGPLLQKYLKHQDDEVLEVLYDNDVISKEAIIAWASEKQHGDESNEMFVKQCEKFIKRLQEACEEDDS